MKVLRDLSIVLLVFAWGIPFNLQAAEVDLSYEINDFSDLDPACSQHLEAVDLLVANKSWQQLEAVLYHISVFESCSAPADRLIVFYLRASLAYQQQKPDIFVDSLQSLVKEPIPANEFTARAHLQLVAVQIQLGRFDAALEEYKKIIERYAEILGDDYSLKMIEAQIAYGQGDLEKYQSLLIGLLTRFSETNSYPRTVEEYLSLLKQSELFKGDIPEEKYFVPQPTYPQLAAAQGTKGYVVVSVNVDESGFVTAVRALEEFPLDAGFKASAMAAAWQLRYFPRVEGGIAVPIENILFKFTFAGKDSAID